MKRLITFILILLMGGPAMATVKTGMKHFYAQHHADPDVEHIRIPKFLLYFSSDDRETRQMLKHMKSLRVFQMEGKHHDRDAITNELAGALKQDGFESILQVNDGGEKVNIYICQTKNYVRQFLLVIDSPDELVVLQAKTKISFDRLGEMMSDYKSGKNKKAFNSILAR